MTTFPFQEIPSYEVTFENLLERDGLTFSITEKEFVIDIDNKGKRWFVTEKIIYSPHPDDCLSWSLSIEGTKSSLDVMYRWYEVIEWRCGRGDPTEQIVLYVGDIWSEALSEYKKSVYLRRLK